MGLTRKFSRDNLAGIVPGSPVVKAKPGGRAKLFILAGER